MQMMEDAKIKKRDMLIPVLLCLLFITNCFAFLIYMTQKNEREKVTYFYSAAQQNQLTLKSRMEDDLRILKELAKSFSTGNLQDKDYIRSVINKINKENQGLEIVYSDKTDQKVPDDVDTYYKVDVTDEEDKSVGMLYVKNSGEILRNITDTMILAGEGIFAILDRQGKVIAGSNKAFYEVSRENRERSLVLDAIKKNKKIFFNMKSRGRKRQTVVMIPLGLNDWYVLNVFPEPNLHSRYMEMAVGIGIMILLSSGLFLSFFHRQVKIINRNQEALLELAYRDSLTGSRNFLSFKREMERLLQTEEITTYAVWYCDIKKFKFINDILGYEEGDRVLKSLSRLFRDYGGSNTLFCRIAGDNFAGLYKYQSREEMEEWFYKLVDLFQNRYLPLNQKIPMELCIGVHCLEEEDWNLSVDQIVDKANIAQMDVKNRPGNQFGFYNKEIRNRVLLESELESEIDCALRNREFKIFLQPKISIQDGNRIVGGEVLVRWENPRKGTIPPGQFVPLMERDGKIILLDRYMFEMACQWLQNYLKSGGKPINLAINVSKIGMLREDFVDFYAKIKEKYQIPDGLLELEFTETVLLNDDVMFNSLVTSLKSKGFICALDDFGSGYSSLNLLKNLKIDVLKLDIMFFRKSRDITRDRIVISNVINMAKELQIKTIAEGVEYVETVDFLKASGCDMIQGYVFARPMSAEMFEKTLSRKDGDQLTPVDIGEEGVEI
ncbi:EAL domain-containing protein [Lacrimispora sp. JR3]|uniref:bifunctional diguanylate cyclase/phosphodiesterase n=1 Tax=Lacrimispora sinapis TaxID=3111456 RepID=UPI003747E403